MDQEVTREGEASAVCSHESGCQCAAPEETKGSEGTGEEMQLAFLLALMPLVVLTFFGQVGLI